MGVGTDTGKLVVFSENVAHHSSVLTLLAIGFERYFAICHPLKETIGARLSSEKVLIPVVWLLSCFATLPFALFYGTVVSEFADGTFAERCTFKDLSKKFENGYIIFIFIVFFAVPIVLLTIMYTAISLTIATSTMPAASDLKICSRSFGSGCRVRLHEKTSASSNKALNSRRQVIRVMIAIMCMYFICLLPLRCLQIWTLFATNDDWMRLGHEGYLNLINCSRILVYVNSAGDPIIYGLLCSNFRAAFKKSFFSCRNSGQDGMRKNTTLFTNQYQSSSHVNQVKTTVSKETDNGQVVKNSLPLCGRKLTEGFNGTVKRVFATNIDWRRLNVTMDANKLETDSDDHNTNQNEMTSRANLMKEQFQDPTTFLAPAAPPGINLEVNLDLNLKIDPSYNVPGTVPVITITPPSPDLSNIGYYDQASGESPSRNMELDLLCTPTQDATLNISRPQVSRDVSCNLETNNDEDIEVICRYSSTPVMSSRDGYSLDDSGCSLMSLNNASPIASAETPTVSPNQSLQQGAADDEVEKVHSSSEQHQAAVLVHPQYLCQHAVHGQPLIRRDAPAAQSAPVYDTTERNVNQCSLPAALILAGGGCPSNPSVYTTYVPGPGCYSDYFPTRDSSWTDLSYRSDVSPVPPPLGASQADPCCYPMMAGVAAETEYFVYPSIYVSSAGLISVLLRNDMSVEMTVDRTIRVVSHNHMMAVATDSRGTAACLYHPAVKVFQMGTTTDIATQNFRARMGGGEAIVFSNGLNFFKLEDSELQPTAPIKFTDILRDQSVNLLFSSEGYGESLVASCMQVAAQAEYANLPKGGVIVRINGVKVTQTGGGDVTVVTGAKFIRLSPHFGTTRLGNRFVDIEVEKDWTVKLTRGSHSFVYCKKRAMVCNGKMEAGFDENNGLKVTNLQPRHPLLAEPAVVRRPVRKPVRVSSTTAPSKRRPGAQGMGRGANMM
ncbi:hypothetical protein Btru_010124 [Bulinus truncatus]|nr:hypothetical protein Btru_010124 [Bulinus truncatus]